MERRCTRHPSPIPLRSHKPPLPGNLWMNLPATRNTQHVEKCCMHIAHIMGWNVEYDGPHVPPKWKPMGTSPQKPPATGKSSIALLRWCHGCQCNYHDHYQQHDGGGKKEVVHQRKVFPLQKPGAYLMKLPKEVMCRKPTFLWAMHHCQSTGIGTNHWNQWCFAGSSKPA